ncbi:MAG: LysR family transcriptional regulator [Proteobacteria bacterium]|nr:LysR family transcriptional regulator [Pseudomonadota bacterium]
MADERHFGKAAERCFVSQPTLSAQIRKLEECLGVPLVEAPAQASRLTATGVKIVQRARTVAAGSRCDRQTGEGHRPGSAGRAAPSWP